ncbi:type II secretion system minor pseudopilin GspK [Psychrobacter sp. GP33]|uniref:type II secretion system minor pseudopilin GspK n=1 Tax=Psychrobacter sp. GP33 TaxID=2758709 RepID=UPI0015F89424|nr:type II secretion system minor pseudopilin GspK [Psychrobacter sp. GP33]
MTATSQRGVALLTILLLVVSITVVAGAMLASQKIAIRRSGVLFDQNQLSQDINAGQQLAITLIRADNTLNETDSAQDIWAQPLLPYSLGTHSISAELRDEASRFNINNLYHDGKTDTVALEVLQRLLTQLNLAPEIAVAILDWQDADAEVYKDGGDENVVYRQAASSGTTTTLPNQPFVSIEQLQEVRGVTTEALVTLRPYLTAVPYYLPININTASPAVLAALIEGSSAEQLQPLITLRQQQPIALVNDIWQLPPFMTLDSEQRKALATLLAVDSGAFMALITATDNANTNKARQRYATVLISKIDAAPATENNNVANGNGNANGNEQNAKVIKVVSQRLWAFRPSF